MKKNYKVLLIFLLTGFTSLADSTFNKHIEDGIKLKKQEKYSEAIEEFSKAIHLNPKSATPYLERGLVYMKCNDSISAMENVGKALTLDPENSKNYIEAGLVYQHFNDFVNAKICWDRASRLDYQNKNRKQIENCLQFLPKKMRSFRQKNECENIIELAQISESNLKEIILSVNRLKKMEADGVFDSIEIPEDARKFINEVINIYGQFAFETGPMVSEIIQDKEGLRKEWKEIQSDKINQDSAERRKKSVQDIRKLLERVIRSCSEFLIMLEQIEEKIKKELIIQKQVTPKEKKDEVEEDEFADFDFSSFDTN
jgi:tetratricopeptide (TPR) repeat protein